MNLVKRLEKLESAMLSPPTRDPDPVDLTLLSADELRELEALAATACRPDGVWALEKLTSEELRTLREVVKKARTGDGEECS